MQCNCGGSSEYEHRVVRNKIVVATYLACPACGRTLLKTGKWPDDDEDCPITKIDSECSVD